MHAILFSTYLHQLRIWILEHTYSLLAVARICKGCVSYYQAVKSGRTPWKSLTVKDRDRLLRVGRPGFLPLTKFK